MWRQLLLRVVWSSVCQVFVLVIINELEALYIPAGTFTLCFYKRLIVWLNRRAMWGESHTATRSARRLTTSTMSTYPPIKLRCISTLEDTPRATEQDQESLTTKYKYQFCCLILYFIWIARGLSRIHPVRKNVDWLLFPFEIPFVVWFRDERKKEALVR